MKLRQWIADNLLPADDTDFGPAKTELKKNLDDAVVTSETSPLNQLHPVDRERIIDKTLSALSKRESLSLFPDVELPPSPPNGIADFACGIVQDIALPVLIKTLERIALSKTAHENEENKSIEDAIQSLQAKGGAPGSP